MSIWNLKVFFNNKKVCIIGFIHYQINIDLAIKFIISISQNVGSKIYQKHKLSH